MLQNQQWHFRLKFVMMVPIMDLDVKQDVEQKIMDTTVFIFLEVLVHVLLLVSLLLVISQSMELSNVMMETMFQVMVVLIVL